MNKYQGTIHAYGCKLRGNMGAYEKDYRMTEGGKSDLGAARQQLQLILGVAIARKVILRENRKGTLCFVPWSLITE